MSEQANEIRRRGRFGLWMVLSLALLMAVAGAGLLALTGRPLPAPGWVVASIEARVNRKLDGLAEVKIGGVQLTVQDNLAPRVQLTNLSVVDARGERIATLPEMRVRFNRMDLLQGRLQPDELALSGAAVTLRRNAQGDINLSFGTEAGLPRKPITSLGEVLAEVDRVLATPVLSGISSIRADALSLTLIDARAGRTWQVGDGRLALMQDDSSVSIELGFGLVNPTGGDPARTVVTFVTRKGSPEARVTARVDNVAAADIAAQAPALAFLKVVEAPISGDFRGAIGADGQIGRVDGRLTFGAGDVRPTAGTRPIAFDSGTLAFHYDPQTRKVTFSEASVQSASLRVRATGHAYLGDMQTGLPKSLVGQVHVSEVKVDPAGLFQKPVQFSDGAIDLKLRLEPFDLRLGQLMLKEGPRRIEANGDFTATSKGWKVSLNAALNQISHSDLLALWPVFLVPQTREWLAENVQTGNLFNVRAAMRLDPGSEPRVSLGYDFRDADVRFMKTMPPIQAGRGYAVLEDKTYTMVVDAGHVVAPQGGNVDVAGSVFEVPDVTIKPPPAVVKLKTDSTITAALSLLDSEPFRFLTKAGEPVDLADGRARLNAEIDLPLADEIDLPDINVKVDGVLTGVSSDKLVKGHRLTSDQLRVRVSDDEITVGGKGKLGVLPIDVTWSQSIAPGKGKTSNVTGTAELSEAFLKEFHIGLPPGALRGKAEAQLSAVLSKKAGTFTLGSDLAGVSLSMPEIGVYKAPGSKGKLLIEGRLGEPARIDKLEIQAGGLNGLGSVHLNPDGSLRLARFDRLRLGTWFTGAVDLKGRGVGRAAAIDIRSGSADLRRAKFGKAKQVEAVPITVALNRLTVSNGIALTGLNGEFTTLGGFNGSFTAGVNGAPVQVKGTVVPSQDGTAVRIQAPDAGAVMAAAKVFANGRGGQMDLTLIPRGEQGQYDGHLNISNIKVVRAPGLAKLLEAISIIGLIDQLNGPGIGFSDVNADFRLTPDAIDVTKGSGVGPSMGISAAGLFHLGTESFDMQGVISPIYFLNGIGSVLTRAGEGLFGFSYTLKGTPDQPKVSVNPFSILTPGMFRDLFRRPAPSLGKQ
ncbi:MAG: hypothetical protein KGK00_16965 [Paracoccaceae bacterium]|nr:hypothetical protein [Paracoccaceae bacterium]